MQVKKSNNSYLYKGVDIVKYYSRSNFKLEIPKIVLEANSITGVVGENGNGKTTLLSIIAGIIMPTSIKEFSYLNKTPKTSNEWINVKNKIAFIPQRIPRWYGTILQNLQLKASIEKIPNKNIDTELNKILDFLDLKKYAHLKCSEISTGYRLRFELARILLGKPQLLILDEPIANLDINAQQQFLLDLKKITQSKEYPVAIILSSQQLHEIETIATQMIFIKRGKAIFYGDIKGIESANNTIEVHVKDEEKLITFLQNEKYKFTKKGVYFQIDIADISGNSFLNKLIIEEIELNYYRDISKSTKRLF